MESVPTNEVELSRNFDQGNEFKEFNHEFFDKILILNESEEVKPLPVKALNHVYQYCQNCPQPIRELHIGHCAYTKAVLHQRFQYGRNHVVASNDIGFASTLVSATERIGVQIKLYGTLAQILYIILSNDHGHNIVFNHIFNYHNRNGYSILLFSQLKFVHDFNEGKVSTSPATSPRQIVDYQQGSNNMSSNCQPLSNSHNSSINSVKPMQL
ncbi:hypothetical protein BLOT_011503 [Blomia tropicalis]|nr:hypothetical protein BLOT_011503 [Blomia tropicalis]